MMKKKRVAAWRKFRKYCMKWAVEPKKRETKKKRKLFTRSRILLRFARKKEVRRQENRFERKRKKEGAKKGLFP